MTEPTQGTLVPVYLDPTATLGDLSYFHDRLDMVDHRPRWRRTLSKLGRVRLRIYMK